MKDLDQDMKTNKFYEKKSLREIDLMGDEIFSPNKSQKKNLIKNELTLRNLPEDLLEFTQCEELEDNFINVNIYENKVIIINISFKVHIKYFKGK